MLFRSAESAAEVTTEARDEVVAAAIEVESDANVAQIASDTAVAAAASVTAAMLTGSSFTNALVATAITNGLAAVAEGDFFTATGADIDEVRQYQKVGGVASLIFAVPTPDRFAEIEGVASDVDDIRAQLENQLFSAYPEITDGEFQPVTIGSLLAGTGNAATTNMYTRFLGDEPSLVTEYAHTIVGAATGQLWFLESNELGELDAVAGPYAIEKTAASNDAIYTPASFGNHFNPGGQFVGYKRLSGNNVRFVAGEIGRAHV